MRHIIGQLLISGATLSLFGCGGANSPDEQVASSSSADLQSSNSSLPVTSDNNSSNQSSIPVVQPQSSAASVSSQTVSSQSLSSTAINTSQSSIPSSISSQMSSSSLEDDESSSSTSESSIASTSTSSIGSDQSSSSSQDNSQLRRFTDVVYAVDAANQTFELHGNRFTLFSYASINFSDVLNSGDIVEIFSEVEGSSVEVQELKVINDQKVTFQESGRIGIAAINGSALTFSLGFSRVPFTLEPNAEYGGTTFDALNDPITAVTDWMVGEQTIINVRLAIISYTQAGGFVLKRLIVDYLPIIAGTVEGITINASPGSALNDELAIVTIDGVNHTVDNSTRFEQSRVHTRELTLDTLVVGDFVSLLAWARNNDENDAVLSTIGLSCMFGFEVVNGQFACRTSN